MKDGKWWDKSWNPVVGCSKCSPGCLNCWAEKMACRQLWMELAKFNKNPKRNPEKWMKYSKVIHAGTSRWNGKVYCDESALDQPLHWRKPRRIFVCDMGDLFHPQVPFEFICKVMGTAAATKHHKYFFLTKRPKRIFEFSKWLIGGSDNISIAPWPEYIHLGVTVCNNIEKWKINVLRTIPATHRFVCFEPLLHGMGKLNLESIDWVIVGCESLGGRAGRFQEGYAKAALDIIEQCQAAGVKVWHKQMPLNGRVSKDMAEWPVEFKVRQVV